MIITNDALLEEFRGAWKCECCGKSTLQGCDPHHLWGKGFGGGAQLDIRVNLIALCRLCHRKFHDGHLKKATLLIIVAKREGLTVAGIEAIINRHLNWNHTMKTVPIKQVSIPDRYRKEIGGTGTIRRSIEKVGLLHPIIVTTDLQLVCGIRRLLACQALGWTEIPANVIDPALALEAEHDENVERKDFTPSERVAIAEAIKAAIGNRQGQRAEPSKNGHPSELREKIPEVEAGKRTADIAAEKAGFGNRKTYEQAKKVVEKGTPELKEAMDAGEVSVSDAAAVADKPAAEQRKAVAKVKKGKSKTLKAAVAEPSEDNPVFDPYGRPIPDVCMAAYRDAEEAKTHLHHLGRVKGWLAEVFKDETRMGIAACQRDALTDARNLIAGIKHFQFYACCVYCFRDKGKIDPHCKACHGFGWLPEISCKQAPREYQKKVA